MTVKACSTYALDESIDKVKKPPTTDLTHCATQYLSE